MRSPLLDTEKYKPADFPAMNLIAPLKLSFGQWLKLMRDRIDLSQAKIAVVIGVKTQTISNWENGKSIPSLTPKQTEELCNLLGVTLPTLSKAFQGEIEIDD